MGLPTVMRLVIEHMRQNLAKLLLLGLAGCRPIVVGLIQLRFTKAVDGGHNPLILRSPRQGQSPPIVMQNQIQPSWLLPLAGQAGQPHPVSQQQMVESAVQAPKKYAGQLAIYLFRESNSGRMQTSVGPSIVSCELAEMIGEHRRHSTGPILYFTSGQPIGEIISLELTD
jgi:hypothetical protein